MLKKLKISLLTTAAMSPSLVSAACSTNPNSNNLFDGWSWTLPVDGVTTFQQNQVFWKQVSALRLSDDSAVLKAEKFSDILAKSQIYKNVKPFSSGTKLDYIENRSSLNLSTKVDRLTFKISYLGINRTYSISWNVEFEGRDILDYWANTIERDEIETSMDTHNDVVIKLKQFEQSESFINSYDESVRLWSVIGELFVVPPLPDFINLNFSIAKIKPINSGFVSFTPTQILDNPKSGIEVTIQYMDESTPYFLTKNFEWIVSANPEVAEIFEWKQVSKMSITLTDYNTLVDKIDEFISTNNNFVTAQSNVNKLFLIVRQYISDATKLIDFKDGVLIHSITALRKIYNSSAQETMKIALAENSNSEAEVRTIRLDFKVIATDQEVVEAWKIPANLPPVDVRRYETFKQTVRRIDWNSPVAATNQLWSALAMVINSPQFKSFPTNSIARIDTSDANLPVISEGNQTIRPSIGLRFQNYEKEIQIPMSIAVTDQQIFDKLNFKYTFNSTITTYADFKDEVEALQVNDPAYMIVDLMQKHFGYTQLNSLYTFPAQALIATRIQLDDVIDRSLVDLIVDIKNASNSASASQLKVARILVSASDYDLIQGIEKSDHQDIMTVDDVAYVRRSLSSIDLTNKINLGDLRNIINFIGAFTNTTSGMYVSAITLPPQNMISGNRYNFRIVIALNAEYREFLIDFKLVTSYAAEGLEWENPKQVSVTATNYRAFKVVMDAINDTATPAQLNLALGTLYRGQESNYKPIPTQMGTAEVQKNLTNFQAVYDGAHFSFYLLFEESYGQRYYVVSFKVQPTASETLADWSLPTDLTYELKNFNELVKASKSYNLSNSTEFASFINLLLGLSSTAGFNASNSPLGVSMLRYIGQPFEYVASSGRYNFDFEVALGTERRSYGIRMDIVAQPAAIVNNYIELLGSKNIILKSLSPAQHNTLINTLNAAYSVSGTTYNQASVLMSSISAYLTNVPPTAPADLRFKVGSATDYNAPDEERTYAVEVTFMYDAQTNTQKRVVFNWQVIVDYDQMLQEFADEFDQKVSIVPKRISRLEYANIASQVNAIKIAPQAIRMYAFLAFLKTAELSESFGTFYGALTLELTEMLEDSSALGYYEIKFSVTAGREIKSFVVPLNLILTVQEQIDELQTATATSNVSLDKFTEFTNSWSSLSSLPSNLEVQQSLNILFPQFSFPTYTKYDILPEISSPVVDESGVSTVKFNLSMRSTVDNSQIGIVTFTVAIQASDDEMLNYHKMGIHTASGSATRFFKLRKFVNSQSVQSASFIGSFNDQYMLLFNRKILTQSSNFRVVKITFPDWNKYADVQTNQQILVTYSYGESTLTKTFAITLSLVNSLDDIRNEFGVLEMRDIREREFLDFEAEAKELTNLYEIQNFLNKYNKQGREDIDMLRFGSKISLSAFLIPPTKIKWTWEGDTQVNRRVYTLIYNHIDAEGNTYLLSSLIAITIRTEVDQHDYAWEQPIDSPEITTKDLVNLRKDILLSSPTVQVNANALLDAYVKNVLKLPRDEVISFRPSLSLNLSTPGLISNKDFVGVGEMRPRFTLNTSANEPIFLKFFVKLVHDEILEIFDPYVSETPSKKVVLLPSQYEDIMQRINDARDNAVVQRVPISYITSMLDEHFLNSGFAINTSFGTTEIEILVSAHTAGMPPLYVDSNKILQGGNIKFGVSTTGGSAIKFFDYPVQITQSLDNIAYNFIDSVMLQGSRMPAFALLKQRDDFNNNIQTVEPGNQSTYKNLKTPVKFTEEIEEGVGASLGDTHDFYDLAGNQQIMLGWTKKGSNNYRASESSKYDFSENANEDMKPLSTTMRLSLEKVNIADVPEMDAPTYEETANHPFMEVDIGVTVAGGLITVPAAVLGFGGMVVANSFPNYIATPTFAHLWNTQSSYGLVGSSAFTGELQNSLSLTQAEIKPIMKNPLGKYGLPTKNFITVDSLGNVVNVKPQDFSYANIQAVEPANIAVGKNKAIKIRTSQNVEYFNKAFVNRSGVKNYIVEMKPQAPVANPTVSGSVKDGLGSIDANHIITPTRARSVSNVKGTRRLNFLSKGKIISRGAFKAIRFATFMVGPIVSIAGLAMTLWGLGLFNTKAKIYDNGYDSDDKKSGYVERRITSPHTYGVFVATKNANGDITSARLVREYNFDLMTTFTDYYDQNVVNYISKPLNHMHKEYEKYDGNAANFLRTKVTNKSRSQPSGWSGASSTIEGTWMGYLQTFPYMKGTFNTAAYVSPKDATKSFNPSDW